ncbi:NAD(P)-binding domain-containing protein, partial [Oenococcus oeni]
MKVGMIGLGKMGLNLVKNMIDNKIEVVGFDLNSDSIDKAASYGAQTAVDTQDLVDKLDSPRIVWVMVPAGKPTNSTIDDLIEKLDAGDILIDGGNSNYKDNL